jgi:hypothetical protein
MRWLPREISAPSLFWGGGEQGWSLSSITNIQRPMLVNHVISSKTFLNDHPGSSMLHFLFHTLPHATPVPAIPELYPS